MPELKKLSQNALYKKYQKLTFTPHQNAPCIVFNMAATLDGIVALQQSPHSIPREKGIGDSIDRKLMRILRMHADCVLNGANTLRVSGTETSLEKFPELIKHRLKHKQARNPLAAVITTDAVFSEADLRHAFFTDDRYSSVLFVSENAPMENLEKVKFAAQGKKFDIIPLPLRGDNVHQMVQILYEHYAIKTLLVEGGPGINGSLIKNGLGDHFFLTQSPEIAIASPQSKTLVMGLNTLLLEDVVQLELLSAYYADPFAGLFTHWQLRRSNK